MSFQDTTTTDLGTLLREALIQYGRMSSATVPQPSVPTVKLDAKTISRMLRLSSDHAWWSADDIATILGLSGRSSTALTRLIDDEDFPAPLVVSEGRSQRRWNAKEVLDFLKKKRDAVYLA